MKQCNPLHSGTLCFFDSVTYFYPVDKYGHAVEPWYYTGDKVDWLVIHPHSHLITINHSNQNTFDLSIFLSCSSVSIMVPHDWLHRDIHVTNSMYTIWVFFPLKMSANISPYESLVMSLIHV